MCASRLLSTQRSSQLCPRPLTVFPGLSALRSPRPLSALLLQLAVTASCQAHQVKAARNSDATARPRVLTVSLSSLISLSISSMNVQMKSTNLCLYISSQCECVNRKLKSYPSTGLRRITRNAYQPPQEQSVELPQRVVYYPAGRHMGFAQGSVLYLGALLKEAGELARENLLQLVRLLHLATRPAVRRLSTHCLLDGIPRPDALLSPSSARGPQSMCDDRCPASPFARAGLGLRGGGGVG